ncbi:MAG: Ig-like domain-containing protein, partial [Syntrophomonas sp.]
TTVMVTMSDNTTAEKAITWDNPTPDTSKAGQIQLNGTVAGYATPVKLTLTIKAIIKNISDLTAEVNEGEAYTPPTTVMVTMSDNTTVEKAVTWDNPTPDTSQAGQIQLNGTVAGYANPVKLTLTIKAIIQNISDLTAEVNEGEAYTPPTTVMVTMSDNTTVEKVVTWDNPTPDTSKASQIQLSGTVAGYAGTIKITLTIKAIIKNISDLTAEVNEGEAYIPPATVMVTMSDNTTAEKAITWDNPTPDTSQAGQIQLNGTVAGYASTVKLTLTIRSLVAAGITVTVAAKETPEAGKIQITELTAAATDHQIYYRVVSTDPTPMYIGDVIVIDGWTIATDTTVADLAAIDGQFVEAVEITIADSKVTRWGKSSATNDGYELVPGSTKVLYYVDDNIGTDYMLAALNGLDYNVTMASSWSDFNSKLNASDFYLAIAFNQNQYLGIDQTIMSTYINDAGKVIFTDWTRDTEFARLFKASYTSITNQTPVTITEPILAQNITNPMNICNTGWGVWSMGLSATDGGQSLAYFPNNDDAIVLGNEGRTVILGFLDDTLPTELGQKFFENLLYLITAEVAPTTTTLTSTDYTVTNTTITNVPVVTDLATFIGKLTPVGGATFKVYQADEIIEVTSGDITTGMKVIVTAQDGITTRTYTITVNEPLIIRPQVSNLSLTSDDGTIQAQVVYPYSEDYGEIIISIPSTYTAKFTGGTATVLKNAYASLDAAQDRFDLTSGIYISSDMNIASMLLGWLSLQSDGVTPTTLLANNGSTLTLVDAGDSSITMTYQIIVNTYTP